MDLMEENTQELKQSLIVIEVAEGSVPSLDHDISLFLLCLQRLLGHVSCGYCLSYVIQQEFEKDLPLTYWRSQKTYTPREIVRTILNTRQMCISSMSLTRRRGKSPSCEFFKEYIAPCISIEGLVAGEKSRVRCNPSPWVSTPITQVFLVSSTLGLDVAEGLHLYLVIWPSLHSNTHYHSGEVTLSRSVSNGGFVALVGWCGERRVDNRHA
ncbi:hypothetical protein Tco_0908134 [Tanacetum coccineum]|uniref:Uncharacterized protein n=1 Tax=Tanacetum coccineum TaxID=301880 RepID=A0ABQ5CMD2_9ASTR